jgi:hypothetical protein
VHRETNKSVIVLFVDIKPSLQDLLWTYYCSGIMRTIVVQNITIFHNRWIDYYKSFWAKYTFITLMLNVARQKKNFTYLRHCHLSHIGNKTWKKLHIDGFLSHLILNWLTPVRLFLKMIKLRSWAMDRTSD